MRRRSCGRAHFGRASRLTSRMPVAKYSVSVIPCSAQNVALRLTAGVMDDQPSSACKRIRVLTTLRPEPGLAAPVNAEVSRLARSAVRDGRGAGSVSTADLAAELATASEVASGSPAAVGGAGQAARP